MPNSSDTEARRIDSIEFGPETVIPHGRGGAGDDTTEGEPSPATWEIGLPSVLALAYVLVGFLFGPAVFDVGAPGLEGVFAAGAVGALLVVSLWGTVTLYDDARRERASGGQFRPNPWVYLVGGVAGLVAVRVVQLLAGAVVTSQPVPYLFGNIVVALPLASLLGGPAYLLRRSLAHSAE